MPRRNIPIGFKLGFVAVALVGICAASFALLGYRAVSELYEAQAQRLGELRKTELERRSDSLATHVSQTTRDALAGLETGRLSRALEGLVAGDSELRVAAIADESGRLLVRTGETPTETLRSGARIERSPQSESTGSSAGGSLAPPPEEARSEEVTTVAAGTGSERLRRLTYPISAGEGAAGRTLGYLQLSWSLSGLDADLLQIRQERDRRLALSIELLVVACGLALGLGLLMAAAASAVITRPVRRLVDTARSLAHGDLAARSDVQSGDEIGVLAQTMNVMADRIGGLIQEARTHAEVAQELAVARNIQRMMIPSRDVHRFPGFQLAGLVEAAQDCGGDFWAVAPLTRHRTLVLVADVTGHGLSSAMLTATARGCIDTVRQLTQGDLRVGTLLRMLDQLLREALGGGLTMTCFASIVDPIEATLTWANAGHPSPFLVRRENGGTRHGRLTSRGNRLGDADGYAFVEHTIATQAGDLLCWYSDGLLETESPKGRPFGARRVRAAIDAVSGEPPKAVAEHLLDAVRGHAGGAAFEDDVTIVVGRIGPAHR